MSPLAQPVEQLQQERLEILEKQRQQIEREIAQLKSASTSLSPHSDAFQLSSSPTRTLSSHARRQSAPRLAAPPMSASSSQDFQAAHDIDMTHPMKRARTTSHQQPRTRHSIQMDRAVSARSMQLAQSMPFTGSGPITPPPPATYQQQPSQPAMTDFFPNNGSQLSGPEALYNHSMQAIGHMQQSSSQPIDMLTQGPVVAPDVGIDVAMYLQAHQLDESLPRAMLADGTSMQSYACLEDYTQTAMSACGSLTEAPTLEDLSMSRQPSNMVPNDGASVVGQLPVGMVRIASQNSNHDKCAAIPTLDSLSTSPGNQSSSPRKRPSPADQQDFSQMGASLSVPPPHMYSRSAPSFQQTGAAIAMQRSDSLQSTDSMMEDMSRPPDCAFQTTPSLPLYQSSIEMERTQSNTSIKSAQSLKLRAKEAIKRQNLNASKAPMLKPRPAPTPAVSVCKDAQGGNAVSLPGAGAGARAAPKEGKAPIAAAKKYERPKHPKVFCDKCPQPTEFRGEHELRRHMDAKHKRLTTKWVCRDPRTAAEGPSSVAASGPWPVQPLNKCKQCNAKKQYGAYYNAAAHLRRTHFKEKPTRSRSSNAAAKAKNSGSTAVAVNPKVDEQERRAGKGGGDWPPMNILKEWMEEISVRVGDGDDNDEQQVEEALEEDQDDEAELSPEDERPDMDAAEDLDLETVAPMAMAASLELYSNLDANYGLYGFPPTPVGAASDMGVHVLAGTSHLHHGFSSGTAIPPLSSANFIYCPSLDTTAATASGLSGGAHWGSELYHSPSTTATITPANTYGIDDGSAAMAGSHLGYSVEDQPEFEFEALFQQPDTVFQQQPVTVRH